MDRGSTIILRAVIYLIAVATLALCVYFLPLAISSDRVGYYRPILIGMYVPAIPFFWALYEAMKLLVNIDRKKAFSGSSVKSLRNIKYCGLAISGLYAAGMPYIFYAAQRDDAPGVALIGFVIVFASFTVAIAAAVFEKLLQNAVDIKSENDLTV